MQRIGGNNGEDFVIFGHCRFVALKECIHIAQVQVRLGGKGGRPFGQRTQHLERALPIAGGGAKTFLHIGREKSGVLLDRLLQPLGRFLGATQMGADQRKIK